MPGCFTQCDALDKVFDNLKQAVAAHRDMEASEVYISYLEMAAESPSRAVTSARRSWDKD